jgi:hypothetical protein
MCISLKPPNNSRVDGKCSFGQRFAAAIPPEQDFVCTNRGDGLRRNFVQTSLYLHIYRKDLNL